MASKLMLSLQGKRLLRWERSTVGGKGLIRALCGQKKLSTGDDIKLYLERPASAKTQMGLRKMILSRKCRFFKIEHKESEREWTKV